MKTNLLNVWCRNGKIPLIEDYPQATNKVDSTTCVYCGVSESNHRHDSSNVLGYYTSTSVLTLVIIGILAVIWLKIEINHYKNKRY